jgi:hypothetical protein
MVRPSRWSVVGISNLTQREGPAPVRTSNRLRTFDENWPYWPLYYVCSVAGTQRTLNAPWDKMLITAPMKASYSGGWLNNERIRKALRCGHIKGRFHCSYQWWTDYCYSRHCRSKINEFLPRPSGLRVLIVRLEHLTKLCPQIISTDHNCRAHSTCYRASISLACLRDGGWLPGRY